MRAQRASGHGLWRQLAPRARPTQKQLASNPSGQGVGQEEQNSKVATFSKRPTGAEARGRRQVLGQENERKRHQSSSRETSVSLYAEHPPPSDKLTVRCKKKLLLLQKTPSLRERHVPAPLRPPPSLHSCAGRPRLACGAPTSGGTAGGSLRGAGERTKHLPEFSLRLCLLFRSKVTQIMQWS